MNYVVDTHTIVWYFTDDKRLSKRALKILENSVRTGLIIIPSIVLAEIMYIAHKGKITISFEETLNKIEEYQNFYIVPLDVEILRIADKINKNLEMHDRLIVSTAIYYDATLITKDRKIRRLKLCKNIW